MEIDFFQHPNSIVDSTQIGTHTRIWAYVHILKNVIIGHDCNICDFCYIENNVTIGNNVTIKSGVYIWEGTKIEDNVFVGPNVVFTNDLRPRSKQPFELKGITLKKHSSIGANSTLLSGITIGEYALIGIGSVVTRDIPPYALAYGNPARIKGWVNEKGETLIKLDSNTYIDNHGEKYILVDNLLRKI